MVTKRINKKYANYTYNEDHQTTSQENEYGYKTSFTYDTFGRKVSEIKPDHTIIKYRYDPMGNKLSENNNTFTYDQRGNVLSSRNKEGTVKTKYNAFNNKVEVFDTNGNNVIYTYTKHQQIKEKIYAGNRVNYQYNENGMLEHVKKNDQSIATYEYNERNAVIKLTQNQTISQKEYDEMGRITTQTTSKDGNIIMDSRYTYDANDNVIKEVIDGKTNTYRYNDYDELAESHKYLDGKKIDTIYQQDIFGNQIESTSTNGKKVYTYNDKNQIEKIKTNKGTIRYRYDNNGNVSEKVNEDGRVDTYTYDDLNQLTSLEQGQFTYDYTYDAERERIKQTRTDTKDYHYDQWYQYSEPLDVVSNTKIKDTFKKLKQQAKKKAINDNQCEISKQDFYDVTYYKEPEVTNYLLDRNNEYTTVLQMNEKVNIYGDTLLQSGNEDIITSWNESVSMKVTDDNVKKISYNDYGSTKDIKVGNGYNGEMLDQSGMIYLRARYYDPGVSRFVQIDNHYDGE